MALIRCPECKQKISTDCEVCPKCGANIKKARVRQQKGGKVALWIVLGFILICFAIGLSTKNKSGAVENEEHSVAVIEDVNQYSKISTEALVGKLGEPVSDEKWTNKTAKGNFEVETYSYDVNSNHYEFIIADDTVVRLSIYSDQNWNGKGSLFSFEDKKQIPKMFGVELSKKSRINDTNSAYVVTQASDTVAAFNVQDMDSKNKTFSFVKITYNPDYFDQ